MIARLFAFVVALTLFLPSYAQRVVVSGHITDAESGETLIAAGVLFGTEGTTSNKYGFYSFTAHAGDLEIRFSCIGYQDRTLSISARTDTTLNITLQAGEQLNEAVITAFQEHGIHSVNTGAISLPLATIKNAPVVFGEPDVLKTIQLLPGIQSGAEGLSGLYIRGGGPDENLFLLDGVPLYNVSHLLGVFSAFTPDAVKDVSVFKGSFPAHYGGRGSGVVDVRTKDGNTSGIHGSVSVGLLNDRIHLEGPVGSAKTSFSLSARALHSLLFAPVIRLAGSDFDYYFYDINAKLVHRFSDKDRVDVTAFSGRDNYSFKGTERTFKREDVRYFERKNIGMDWGNLQASVRWNHVFSGRLFANTTVAVNNFNSDAEFITTEESRYGEKRHYGSNYASAVKDVLARSDWEYNAGKAGRTRLGAEFTRHHFIPGTERYITHGASSDTSFFVSDNRLLKGWEAAAYISQDYTAGPLSLSLGIRGTLMESEGRTYDRLEPRISASLELGWGFLTKASYARMNQFVHLLSSSQFALPTDIWVPITPDIPPLTTDIASTGFYYSGIEGWEIHLESYYKSIDNVLEYRDGVSYFGDKSSWDKLCSVGEGRAYGAELFARKTYGLLTGWLGYTISKTERRFPEGDVNYGRWFPYKYDRRHDVVLNACYRPRKNVDLNVTWTFASGGWITISERQIASVFPEYDRAFSIRQDNYVTSRNNYRVPSSQRLNIGLNLHYQKKHGESIWNFSLYNAYCAMNPNLVFYEYEITQQDVPEERGYVIESHLRTITYLPICPSIGYSFSF